MKELTIVGAGLSGCTLAYLLRDEYDVTIYEEKTVVGGLCLEGEVGGRKYHRFGGHFFHTDNEEVNDFVVGLTDTPLLRLVAKTFYGGRHYDYPITDAMIEEFGREKCWDMFIRNYSAKMWGRDVPQAALDRVRIAGKGETFFTDKYQYSLNYTKLFRNLTEGIKVLLGRWVVDEPDVVLTGRPDLYFKGRYGRLPWRGLWFNTKVGVGPLPAHLVNYPERGYRFIRKNDYSGVYEHGVPIISTAYPTDREAFYPVESPGNRAIFEKYKEEAGKRNVVLLGRLGTYRYLNMDEAIWEAMKLAKELKEGNRCLG